MDVAFHGRHHDAPLRFRTRGFLRFHEWHQIGDSLFHHARALYDLWQKHFAGTEQVADHAHPGHKRALDHVQWSLAFLTRFLRIGVDIIGDAFDQCVFEPSLDRLCSPRFIRHPRFIFCFYVFRKIDQPLGCIASPIQQHVFDALS